jgi:hypothetical protein
MNPMDARASGLNRRRQIMRPSSRLSYRPARTFDLDVVKLLVLSSRRLYFVPQARLRAEQ